MKLLEPLELKFGEPLRAAMSEYGVMDTALERHPEIIKLAEPDITAGGKDSGFGRQDAPGAERIVRAGIYKELKGLDCRDLEMARYDSRLREKCVKTNRERPYSFQVFQKYISRIKAETLEEIMIAINKTAIDEGIESIEDFRQDSAVVESDIHYPADGGLIYDRINKGQRLLEQLKEEVKSLELTDYRSPSKRDYFKLGNTMAADKRQRLFIKQLNRMVLSIEQVSKTVKKKS
jgi:IS5 family transposase